MGTLGSILGGLLLLLLGLCGGIGVCSHCESSCAASERARLVDRDDAVRPELDARVQRLLPGRAGDWTRAAVPTSKPGGPLSWEIEYRGPGYDAEQTFQASSEGEAAFQAWSASLDRRIAELKAREAAEIEAKAPQPLRYETTMALSAANGQRTRGRAGWNASRLALHRVRVRLDVFQKEGVLQTQWMYQATLREVPPEGFVEADRASFPVRSDGQNFRHRYRAGSWQIAGTQRNPAPGAYVRAIQISLTGVTEENLEEVWKALGGKALVQGLQAP